MKKCLNCDIFVGGNKKTCPICQNALKGEDTAENWPVLVQYKKKAFLYKLQLFVVLALIVVALSLDFLFELNDGRHYSLIIALTLIILEMMIRGFTRKHVVITRLISVSALHVTIILLLIGWYYDQMKPIAYFVIPIILGASLIANFVFALIDKTENAMVYLLLNILVALVSYPIIELYKKIRPIPWIICLMISVISFIGIVVFKGPKVLGEIRKRMNI